MPKPKKERTKLLAVVVEIEAPPNAKAVEFKDYMRRSAQDYMQMQGVVYEQAKKRSTVRTTVHSRAGL